tara:strand:- start:196 stop:306 length:111 start_codon:yes stop_codon:yes gene_type:complete
MEPGRTNPEWVNEILKIEDEKELKLPQMLDEETNNN